ncbi:MAG TPA: FAD-binding oxidoreductase [Thermohalobaculum sp.]|nr:FAD-binding oxidoreductase [Thermohalobaculum sp.]
MRADIAIVGGGVVGLSLAYGLRRLGRAVLVLDGGDGDFRASRGNFGLIWVQGKGVGAPHYARWTRRAAAMAPDFAAELAEATGIDLALRQPGGFDYFTDEAALAAQVTAMEGLRAELGGDYPFEVVGPNALRREMPEIGPKVVGAILGHEDGHMNPLRLLRALAQGVRHGGGRVETGVRVTSIAPLAGGGFALALADGREAAAEKVVLAAGLGAAELGPQLGFKAQVRPQRGQVLITERLAPFITRPSATIRQVDEGGVQIGASHEEVGLDDRETVAATAALARHAVEVFPLLARARLVRSWGALRILTPDGLPIYHRSETHPGAYLVTCHSGITLAAVHARLLPLWIEGAEGAPDLEEFSERRFAIQTAA